MSEWIGRDMMGSPRWSRSAGDVGAQVYYAPAPAGRLVWRVLVGTLVIEQGYGVDVDDAQQQAEAVVRRLHADIEDMMGGDL